MRSLASLSLVTLLLASAARAQTTWFVDASAPPPGSGTPGSPYSDLQFALAQGSTVSGDTLIVAPGTYVGGFDFLGKNVIVQSSGGAAVTILDGGGVWPVPSPGGFPPDPSPVRPVVTFTNGESSAAVLDGFTVQHGRGFQTGAPTSFARRGAGVYVSGASPTLRNLVVKENAAHEGVGMFFEGSTSSVSASTITGNTTHCYCGGVRGVGIYASSAIAVDGCTITLNTLATDGGGIWASAGTFTGCTISSNNGWFGGGANLSGTAMLVGCTLQSNTCGNVDGDPGRGGGVYGGTAIGCLFENNGNGAHAGGGAYGASLTDCVLRANRVHRPNSSGFSPVGGAGAVNSTLLRCDVVGNVAGSTGSIFYNDGVEGGGVLGGSATDSRIHGNTAYVGGIGQTGRGGAGAAFATLVRCDVYDNTVLAIAYGAPPLANLGGGGMHEGTATRCRFWNNSAGLGGGAANATVVNCTFSGNVASGGGGAVASVYGVGSPMVVRSSILWHDAAPEALQSSGTLTVDWSDVEGGFAGTGNVASDPLFQSEANHDFHLLAASPCIDTGDPTAFDPDGSRVDMGAFPFECGTHNYCVGKANSLGCVPTAGSLGTATSSGLDDFHVTCDLARKNSTGLLLWSKVSDAAPFFNGTLCVGPTIVRTPAQNAGGTGTGPNCTGHFDFFFSHAYMTARGIAPFDTVFTQWYMRDVTHPDGTGVCVSDGLAFTVCP